MAPTLRSGRRRMPSCRAVARRSSTTLSESLRLFCTIHCSHCSSICLRVRRTGVVISTPVTCGEDTPVTAAAGTAAASSTRAAAASRLPSLLNIADPRTIEQVFEKSGLLGREVAGRLLPEHVEQIDVQTSHLEVFDHLAVG